MGALIREDLAASKPRCLFLAGSGCGPLLPSPLPDSSIFVLSMFSFVILQW